MDEKEIINLVLEAVPDLLYPGCVRGEYIVILTAERKLTTREHSAIYRHLQSYADRTGASLGHIRFLD